MNATNPSAVDAAIDQGVDVGATPAAPSSPPESPDVRQARKCVWCGLVVRDDVFEKYDASISTQAAAKEVATSAGPLESYQYTLDGMPDPERAEALTISHLAAHMPLQVAKRGSFTTKYGPSLDRMLETASDDEVYCWAEAHRAFSARAQALAGLMQRQTTRRDTAAIRISMEHVQGAITEWTTLEEFCDAVKTLVELVRFAADRGQPEAAFQIAELSPGDGAKRAAYHELAEAYWRVRDKAREARALALGAHVEQRLQAAERAPQHVQYVHEYFGLDFYPVLRERLLADGHAALVERMERTELRENILGVNPYRVWLVQELTSYANDLVRQQQRPDEQLRLAIRYVYLNRTAYWHPSNTDYVEPFEPLDSWYFGRRH